MKVVALTDLAATEKLAQAVAACFEPGHCVALIGDLGAGKTTFVAHLARQFLISAQVSSPTYVLEHRYPSSSGTSLEHWDLYRCREIPAELLEPVDSATIRLIEWADRFPELNSSCDWQLIFELAPELDNNSSRTVKITCHNSEALSKLEALCKSLSL
jgi:tRNA threonylcarbamoyladenosine biosynthesis protein TsaE